MPVQQPDRPFIRQSYRPLFGPTLVPTITLSLRLSRRPSNIITVDCLLDSGADQSIMSFEIAEALGLRRNQASIERGEGFGGHFRMMTFQGEDFMGSVSDDGSEHRFGMSPRFHEPGVKSMQVLGRLDFFKAFSHIEIHERAKYVDLYL